MPVLGPGAGGDGSVRAPPATTLGRAAAPVSRLDLERAISVPGGARILRYAQRVGGIPVLDPTYVQAAKALIDADQLLYCGAHCSQIATEMNKRKFFTPRHPAPGC